MNRWFVALAFIICCLAAAGLAGGRWCRHAKLTASDAEGGDNFGIHVAIDGNTAVVGAHAADGNDNSCTRSGAVYVFTFNGSTWNEQQRLYPSDPEEYGYFGGCVAIDGDTIVVGSTMADACGTDSGAAYVFTRSGSTWTQRKKLAASDGTDYDWFGFSVAIDGNTIVVGAYKDDPNGDNSGSAYVYTGSSSTWTQRKKLTASDGDSYDYFGYSVGIDGNTIVIGASNNNHSDKTDPGAAYVYTGSGSTWTQQQKLTDANDPNDDEYFGGSVDIEANRIIVGARGDIVDGNATGGAFSFTREATTWTQQESITASDGVADDRFGWSVSLSDGWTIVGAYYDDDNGTNSGSAYVFLNSSIADLNCDSCVDFDDYTILAGQWKEAPGSPSADIAPEGGDGVVEWRDLGVLVVNWLSGC